MYCHNCGHKNPEGANFCSTCGEPLHPEDPQDTTITFTIDIEGEGEEELTVPLEELEEGKAILVVRRGPDAGTRFGLTKDQVTCGRDPTNDIFLNDVTVSRQHAEFHRDGDRFTLVDTGSLNGTFLNRKRIDKVHLSNGDEIQIGKFKLIFFTGGAPAA